MGKMQHRILALGRLVVCAFAVATVMGPEADASYQFVTQWGSAGTGRGQLDGPHGIAVDSAGNVYVTELFNNRMQKFTSNGTYLKRWGAGGQGDGHFDLPTNIAVDAAGNLYVADTGNCRIQKLAGSGLFLMKWGSSGSRDGQFKWPWGVAVDAGANVYVADADRNCIQKFTGEGMFLTKWGARGTGDGQFRNPLGLAVDAAGSVYVADAGNYRIQKFTGSGIFLTKWGAKGSAHGQFQWPHGVAVDGARNVYVADTYNNRIQKFTSEGLFLTEWGSQGSNAGQFDWAVGVVVDATGNVYVADQRNDRIQKFARAAHEAPILTWLDTTGYEADGVDPDQGAGGDTRFRLKVLYSDADGHAPRYVSLHLRRNGKPFREFAMVRGVGDYTTGRVYRRTRKLPPGSYEHCFRARDRDGLATGEATVWTPGPTVGPRTSVALTTLCAVPTNGGTQITFSLSAAAQVEARILNIGGQPIKTLCRARGCEAGSNTLLWDGRDDTGLAVPNGTYLVEVAAKAGDGTEARALGQTNVAR
jgi:DNA-binding beta-propeller fold protein YncE